jgi:hypothetical protein
LPRICDVLKPYAGLAAGTNSPAVFKCPTDRVGLYGKEGSSYEWNAHYNGKPVDNPRTSANPIGEALLMYDYENFHSTGPIGTKNVLYADYHVTRL